ncbi:MAG: hypothetical protein LBI44_00425 [Oscillospiraceae bacterium]|nr:hypothetical protein [Oscillospiraceae bacterium]
MNWGEIKKQTLYKLFAQNSDGGIDAARARAYLPAMPQAACEGLALLCLHAKARRGRLTLDAGALSGEGGVCRCDLAEAAEDFLALETDGVYFDSGARRDRVSDYTLAGGHMLLLPKRSAGAWVIYYTAAPPAVTERTPDGEEPPLAPEAAALLPLYMASQLMKDDDAALASQYRADFERGMETLRRSRSAAGREDAEFFCASGWW